MADMPTPALFKASTRPIVMWLSATDRCSSQAVIAMQPAVPLWKVIVGLAPAKLYNRARKGPVFSFPALRGRNLPKRRSQEVVLLQFAPKLALGHLSRAIRVEPRGSAKHRAGQKI